MPQLTFRGEKPVEKWSSRDILIYFSDKIAEVTGTRMQIEPVAWVAYLSRIKGFQMKLNLSPQMYKDFIDIVCDKFLRIDGYVPAFGAIVSEKVYHIARKYINPTFSSEFEKLARELYSDNGLFSKLIKKEDQ
jgi:hypothetical protein